MLMFFFYFIYVNPFRVGGEQSVCVLRAHSLLLHHRSDDPGPLPEH